MGIKFSLNGPLCFYTSKIQTYLTPSIIVALSPPPSGNQCFHLGPLSVPFSLLKMYVHITNIILKWWRLSTYNIYLNWNKDSGSGQFSFIPISRALSQLREIISIDSYSNTHSTLFTRTKIYKIFYKTEFSFISLQKVWIWDVFSWIKFFGEI